MSTTARRRWSIRCCARSAPSAPTSRWPSARSIRTSSSASAASRSWRNARRSMWGGARINIVDTPGHADFGGEVERILCMVDGVLVLVDAAEGPMPQTKFVVAKALRRGLRPIVVINKIDRPDARAARSAQRDLRPVRAARRHEQQLDFPTLFASGRDGWAVAELDAPARDLAPLFDLIVAHVPPPQADPDAPFAMLATTLDYDPYLGRVLTGLIHSGVARLNMPVKSLSRDGGVDRAGAADQAARLSRPRTAPDRGGAGRRHHCRRGARADDGRRHDLCARGRRAAAGRPDRPADPGDDVFGQRQPACRARGQQGDLADDRRAPLPRGRGQCRDPRDRKRRQRMRSRWRAAANCSSAC